MADRQKEAQVLAVAAATLLKVAAERDTALARNAELDTQLDNVQKRLESEKLAAVMHEKGLNRDVEFPELVEQLEKAAHEGRLPVLQEAVKMAAADMGGHIARINNDEVSGSGSSDLEGYLLGSVG